MDSRETEALVQRLVKNPHDQDALSAAHAAGQSDPRAYAGLLEKVGSATSDPAFACHWLTEAATVWSSAIGDAHRAARALMLAIDRDPTQPAPAENLAALYRDKGDVKALVALLERRSKALTPLAQQDPALRAQVATIHEDLGRLWSEPPLSQAKKAIEHYKRAIEHDPGNQYAVYGLRELYKVQQQWAEAIPLFEMEQRLVQDPERLIALYQDEAEVRRSAGDLAGTAGAYRAARHYEGGADAVLKQALAATVLERLQAGENVPPEEREESGGLFVELSEEFPGEHGLSYSLCALELSPANDRAMQLALYYGEQLGRVNEAAPRAAGYLTANPQGAMAAEARQVVSRAMEMGGDESLIEALGPAPGADVDAQIESLIEMAQALARKARKNEAATKYRQVLALDPDNIDAIGFLEPYLRQTRKLAELRDVLLKASRSEDADVDQRKAWLKEVATLCEGQLRDQESAASALRQIVALDPEDEAARGQLKRLLEKGGQWDALAEVLTEEAEQTADVEARISIERNLAKLHEQRRKDPVASGEAWARIAALAPDDDQAILTAVKSFERAERNDLAAGVISDNIAAISNEETRAELLERLGELRLELAEATAAGEAFAEAASLSESARLWEAAEQAFVTAQAWDQAATAADERAQLASANAEKAGLYAMEAEYLLRAGDASSAVLRLEQATDLAPTDDALAEKLEAHYAEAGRNDDLAIFLLKRAEKIRDRGQRSSLRRRAAQLQRDVLGDVDAARQTLIELLEDGDDVDALVWLADDAEQAGEAEEAAGYLSRLVKAEEDPANQVTHALREAGLRADLLDDAEGAIERYEAILESIDPKHTGALLKIADLKQKREDQEGEAEALERRLALLPDGEEKVETAERLAQLYEGPLEDPKGAVRVLDVIRALEPDDFDAVQRLSELCERLEDWPRVAELLAVLIEVEGDDEEISRMTRRMAEILHQKVQKSDDALAALLDVADSGDEPCREEYVTLGDDLGWKGIVATKLVEWYISAPVGEKRHEALSGAFSRFLEVGREADAANVAKELARTRGASPEIASTLETIAVKLKDLDALAIAHDLKVQDLSGPERAEEFVRQAEVLCEAGVDTNEAVQHGEQALTSVSPEEAAPLLDRLAKIAGDADRVIDVYERQVTRCKAPVERLEALARAAQKAAENEKFDRARQFFDIALGGGVQEDTLSVLQDAAQEGDQTLGGERLRRTLAEALATGGQGSRDGGRTRSAMLGRAAQLAYQDLKDVDQAFTWLGDAIVAHVDDERLDALESLADEVGEPRRAEAILNRALEEVFDGPLVRKLLARRAALRKERLQDPRGAAVDLKRLHDLSPSDTEVMDELSALYTELGDYRGMVQLYEDQILRGKDLAARAELARKVARLWEERLDDPREAADAWRRVLRMKAGDPEATEGLERAKTNMLNRPKPESVPVEPQGEAGASPKAAAAEPEPEPEPEAKAAEAAEAAPSEDEAEDEDEDEEDQEDAEDAATVPPPAASPVPAAVKAKPASAPPPAPSPEAKSPAPPPAAGLSSPGSPPAPPTATSEPRASKPPPPPSAASAASRPPPPPGAPSRPSRPPPAPSKRPLPPPGAAGTGRGSLPPPRGGRPSAPGASGPGNKPPPPPGAPGSRVPPPPPGARAKPAAPVDDDDGFIVDDEELIDDGPA